MKLRLYLDTSVISAYVDDRMPERRRATAEFWNRLPEFDVSVSELTVTEVRATREVVPQRRMDELIAPFEVLPVADEARELARAYVRRGVFSPSTLDDALHVAVAVVTRRDLLVSWNFRHLVNRNAGGSSLVDAWSPVAYWLAFHDLLAPCA
jgi:predicted nucleic acid-binding protein